jgi:hypothetical protein
LLTYETAAEGVAKAPSGSHAVVFKATNSLYPFVARLPLVSGGFFTQREQESAAAVATLNKKAAFDLFGTLDAAGNTFESAGRAYRVTGVLDDGDAQQLNIYIPAGAGDWVQALLCAPEGAEDAARNALKQLGLTADRYNFINLETVAALVREKSRAALLLAAAGLALLGLRKSAGACKGAWRALQGLRQQFYLEALLKTHPAPLAALGAGALALLLCLAALAGLAEALAAFFLRWGDCANAMAGAGNFFSAKLLPLKQLEAWSEVLFWVYVPAAAGCVAGWMGKAGGKSIPADVKDTPHGK